MEPQVRYARTEDGVNIAYYTLGSGPPFLWLALPMTHLLEEWRTPQFRAQIEGSARFFTMIRMDFRGFGMSDREAPDISFAGMARDIEAVMDRVTEQPAIVLAMAQGVQPGVLYAAAHPERVSRLILLSPATNIRGGQRGGRLDAIWELARVDWEFAAETVTRSFWVMSNEQVEQMSRVLMAAVDPETLDKLVNETERECDASETLKRLSMPTLVLHDRSNQNVQEEAARKVAALIPDGRFVELDSAWHTARAIARFLGETGAAVAPPRRSARDAEPTAEAGMTAILFADIVESTALTERLGDAAFREKARELDAALRTLIRDNGGTPVEGKLLGDGVLATFASAAKAIDAALAAAAAGNEAGLQLHLGLHAGDVIREENNVYGGAVNLAARIAGESAPGELLVSDVVRGLARTSAGVTFEDRGERTLKGITEPQRIFAVRSNQ
jgi:class 3 adenylate cyclase